MVTIFLRSLASRAALVAVALSSSIALAATPGTWLNATQIHSALNGKSIAGQYANGRTFTERYLPDGRVEYVEHGISIGGRWSVTAGTLCTIYDDDPAGGCYRVARSGANCFEFYFASRTEDAAPGPAGSEPKWTARGSITSEKADCNGGASV